YVASYKSPPPHVLPADGRRLFPPGQRLLNHWNLRDEIKARYGDPEGLPKQRLIALVMDRIVRQQIPPVGVEHPAGGVGARGGGGGGPARKGAARPRRRLRRRDARPRAGRAVPPLEGR